MSKQEMPYHKYVFDAKKRVFVGKFEEMYQQEDKENYDSWHQEDVTTLPRLISLAILNRYNYSSILDIGCGKGSFTHLLKKANNEVTGIDISGTAVNKAKARYKGIDFKAMSIDELMKKRKQYDLVVIIEVLSYLKNWREVIKYISTITKYLYVTIYLPSNPIGFIKTFDSLKNEITRYFKIEVENVLDNESIFIFAVKK